MAARPEVREAVSEPARAGEQFMRRSLREAAVQLPIMRNSGCLLVGVRILAGEPLPPGGGDGGDGGDAFTAMQAPGGNGWAAVRPISAPRTCALASTRIFSPCPGLPETRNFGRNTAPDTAPRKPRTRYRGKVRRANVQTGARDEVKQLQLTIFELRDRLEGCHAGSARHRDGGATAGDCVNQT
jgi:hypothetical protein